MDSRVDTSWRHPRDADQPLAVTVGASTAIWLGACALVFYQFVRTSTVPPALLQTLAYWALAVLTPVNVFMAQRRRASPWTTLILVAVLLITYATMKG
jgi:hypothetical protein